MRDTQPRARYTVTSRARTGILARRFFPDALFDRFLKKQLSLDQIRESLLQNRS